MGRDAVQHTDNQAYQHFEGTCYLHLQEGRVTLYPEDGNQQILPKHSQAFLPDYTVTQPQYNSLQYATNLNSRKLHSHSKLVYPSNLCSRCVRFEHRSGQTLS